ncbi:uncharacterized protein LOC116853030 [Odontomachus brunneus]|uniref:uncharacterized protein LOC116853030 n=1 Tax=Odontomachus brunneus TaxID=486640 RepID=UPI0013F18E49|nr:uncharacterized protein LOC116853030 [Odontomachus brunneus]
MYIGGRSQQTLLPLRSGWPQGGGQETPETRGVGARWKFSDGLAVTPPPIRHVEGGAGYVAVEWRPTDVVGCYAPPYWTRAEFGRLLDRLEALIMRHLPRLVIVSGDFNVNTLWGSPGTCPRGADLQEWAASTGLSLQNRGRESTFVGWQGESIVDLTWTSPAAARQVQGWRVATEAKTGSDHRAPPRRRPSGGALKARQRGDPTAKVGTDLARPRQVCGRHLRGQLGRSGARNQVPRFHWGGSYEDPGHNAGRVRCVHASVLPPSPQGRLLVSAEITEVRRSAGRAWRAMAALRDRDARVAASAVLTARKGAVRRAIAKAKVLAWEDLISSVDREPWGCPYRMVMRRLRPWAPPLTDTLNPELLDKIVEGLFPGVGNNIPPD